MSLHVDHLVPDPLARIIAERGPWRVLGAALRALIGGRPSRIYDVAELSDHLLRDIGVLPLPQGRPPDARLF